MATHSGVSVARARVFSRGIRENCVVAGRVQRVGLRNLQVRVLRHDRTHLLEGFLLVGFGSALEQPLAGLLCVEVGERTAREHEGQRADLREQGEEVARAAASKHRRTRAAAEHGAHFGALASLQQNHGDQEETNDDVQDG